MRVQFQTFRSAAARMPQTRCIIGVSTEYVPRARGAKIAGLGLGGHTCMHCAAAASTGRVCARRQQHGLDRSPGGVEEREGTTTTTTHGTGSPRGEAPGRRSGT